MANVSRASCFPSPTDPGRAAGTARTRSGAGPAEDETAARRVLGGDAEAFEALVERLHGPLLRLARALLGGDARAGDVVQEAWLVALDRIGSYRGHPSLAAWISRILVDLVRARAKGGPRSLAAPEAEEGDPAVHPERFDAAGRWCDPPAPRDVAAPDGDSLAVLEAALAALPPLQQAVLVLRDRQRLSAAETCEVLRLAPAAQAALLNRARAAVWAALEADLART